MSKGSKRHSAKYNEQLFNRIFPRPPKPQPNTDRPDYLDMTPEEIDRVYWNMGKFDRTQLKKQAATERMREHVREVLEAEQKQPKE